MFKNNLKVAFRNIARHQGFSFINIAGLTLGLTACLLIGLFVWDEKQFDTFIPEGDRVYRLYYEVTSNEEKTRMGTTPPMFTTALQQHFPEVEKTLRILNNPSKELFEAGDKKMYEGGGLLAEKTFFEFFPLTFTYGTPARVLDSPRSIVISQTLAEKYFGRQNPVGKELRVDKVLFQVTGVFRSNPKFHLAVNYVMPLAAANLSEEQLQSWSWYQFNNYVLLKPATNVTALERKFQEYTRPFIKDKNSVAIPFFQALSQIHLYSADFQYDIAVRGNSTYVNALSLIAVFILIIAVFNFVNLATAKSLQRAKEVGVRKTIGASRQQLIGQFMGETMLLTFISMLLSCVLTSLALPWLNTFAQKDISFALLTSPVMLLVLVGLCLVVGVVAGFYPALVLSGFQPLKVLKGGLVADGLPGRTPWLRHSLVVLQFGLSILLIISAMVVISQVNYLHHKDLGFNKEQIMFFPMRGDNMEKNQAAFKQQLQSLPGVAAVSIGYGFPGDMFGDGPVTLARQGQPQTLKATQVMVDYDYIKTMGLELVVGRDFSQKFKTDKEAAYIINETAAREYGFSRPEQAIGQTLQWPTWRDQNLIKKGQIIGVVKDFHFKSLYDKVEPAVLHIYPEAYWKVAVKIKAAAISTTVGQVEKVWSTFTPDYPIEYTFLDQGFASMYKAEENLKTLLWIFTVVTIFVSCLGLFGLAAYAAERRRKEIGIRKVLGASLNNLLLLLSKEFITLIVIANILAWPLAWWAMHQWLQDFAYRINMNLWIFVAAGGIAVVVALLTISFQSIKAAITNPVHALRNE